MAAETEMNLFHKEFKVVRWVKRLSSRLRTSSNASVMRGICLFSPQVNRLFWVCSSLSYSSASNFSLLDFLPLLCRRLCCLFVQFLQFRCFLSFTITVFPWGNVINIFGRGNSVFEPRPSFSARLISSLTVSVTNWQNSCPEVKEWPFSFKESLAFEVASSH